MILKLLKMLHEIDPKYTIENEPETNELKKIKNKYSTYYFHGPITEDILLDAVIYSSVRERVNMEMAEIMGDNNYEKKDGR